jgi:nucleoside-diphosphate-sugar epimerase
MKSILVTGGAGYVGAVLIPKLLNSGQYKVKVLDLMIYGEDVLDAVLDHPNLEIVKGDIRDRELLERTMPGNDTVIHLACISNDPSYELDPELGKSINYDAFLNLVEVAKSSGVKLFIYASSSSVYGVKSEPEVTEDLPLEPLTDYSKYKALCEDYLLKARSEDFAPVVIRPSTVCGYSPRLRLDLTVNILTNHAINKGEITVFGGDQMRPNIHIEDMTDLYCLLLELPKEKIAGKIFNAGYQNYKVKDIAEMVKKVIGENTRISVTPSNDPRSYHVSSEKIKSELGFIPHHTIEEAIQELRNAFEKGLVPDPMTANKYYNVKRMNEIGLK